MAGEKSKKRGRRRRNRNRGQRRKRMQGKGQGQQALIKGKGSYTIGALAAKVAKMIPKGTFESLGGALGSAAGRGLATFTGVGDYVFNDLVHTPAMPTRAGNQLWRISNCEYVGDLLATGSAFAPRQFTLNPGDPASFPWLSRVARLYQKYKFEQLIFEFRSNSSDYAAAGPLGSVVMAPCYNVLADVPLSKQQLEAYAHAVSTKPSNSIMCGVECDPREDNIKWYYVRAPFAAATQFTDPGYFVVATNGLPSSSGALGEIWVHYTIKFDDPILVTSQSNQIYGHLRQGSNTAGLMQTPFGNTLATPSTQVNDGIPDTAAVAANITFNAGVPSVPYYISADSSTFGRYWISAVGTYLFSYSVTMFTGYVSVVADQRLYSATLPVASSGTSVSYIYNTVAKQAGDGDVWAGMIMVVTGVPNVAVDFAVNSALSPTGAALTIIDGTAASHLFVIKV